MAREKGSVRIGPVSVFALVVILGLAVLAVLSAATAQASHTEAQAQADFTRSAYVNDAAAAQALADIDTALADAASAVNAGGQDDKTAASAGVTGLESSADPAQGNRSTRSDEGEQDNASAAAESTTAAASATASARNLDAAMGAVAAVLPQGQLDNGCTAESSVDGTAVHMIFSTEDGRTLDVELTICEDLTYSLERWSVTTEWNQEPDETKLWQSG